MKIVAIDPGLRNFGLVVLERDEHTGVARVTYARVLDLAGRADTDSFKCKSISACLHEIEQVRHADLCVVEDQNFGRANTNPDNLLVQAAAGATALALGAKELLFYQSSFKFRCFFSLTPTLSGRVKGKYKLQSKVLAQNLIASFNVQGETGGIATSDHLSDAFGLAFAALVKACERARGGPLARPRSEPLPVPFVRSTSS